MTEDDFLQIIDSQRYVIVGIEPCSDRLHKLIYSEQDEDHFVAIQDMATGEVITILSLQYHENLAWKISPKKLKQAVLRISSCLHASIYKQKEAPVQRVPWLSCSISLVVNYTGFDAMKKTFGSYRFAERPENAEDALCNTGLIEKILAGLRKFNIPLDSVEEILLYNPRQNFFLKLPWDTLESFEDDLGMPRDDCYGTSLNIAPNPRHPLPDLPPSDI